MAAALISAPYIHNSLNALTVAFFITLGHGVVLGLPIYLLFRRFGWVAPGWAALAGAAVGALPFAVVNIGSFFARGFEVNGTPMAAEGLPSGAGGVLWLAAILAAVGGVSGLAFWAVLRITRSGGSARSGAHHVRTGASLIALASSLALTAAVLALPAATQDRSCHNPDARPTARPFMRSCG